MKNEKMSFREATIKIFEGNIVPFTLFQPRIEPWYNWHSSQNLLPEKYGDLSLMGLFNLLDVSMRYLNSGTGIPSPVVFEYDGKVRFTEKTEEERKQIVIETPYGELVHTFKKGYLNRWLTFEFPVKKKEDFKKLSWLYSHTNISFAKRFFELGDEFFGERGYPQFFVPRSPYQALWIQWMKFEDLIYALQDYRETVEETMKAIKQSYDGLYQQIISYGKVRIVNFGENIDSNTVPPRYFERYCIPFYEERAKQLQKAGIHTHIHIDGSFHSLLGYLKHLPFSALEALTPLPQGDVTIEEIKENIGDKILIDGIPGILFLPEYSREDLMECVEKLVKLFAPRLILGISDELPEGAQFEESMERIKLVAEYCRKTAKEV